MKYILIYRSHILEILNALKETATSKKYMLAICSLFIMTESIYGQWSYKSKENAFDGKYKYAMVTGRGGSRPFTSPTFVANHFQQTNSLNIYITDAGYSGCFDKDGYVTFDGDKNIYRFNISTNAENDTWFLEKNYIDKNSLTLLQLLEKVKSHNKMFIRLSSSCSSNDYEFPLSGSTKAVDFILKDYLIQKAELDKIEEAKRQKGEEIYLERKRFLESLSTGEVFSALTTYSARVFVKEGNDYKFYKDVLLEDGATVKFSNYYYEGAEYCILRGYKGLILPKDTILYMRRSAIDFNTVKKGN